MDRVENSVSPGMPDYNGTYDGRDYWVEVKVEKTLKRHEAWDLLRPSQRAWLIKRLTTGGGMIYYLLVYREKEKAWDILYQNNTNSGFRELITEFCYSGKSMTLKEVERRMHDEI